MPRLFAEMGCLENSLCFELQMEVHRLESASGVLSTSFSLVWFAAMRE